MSRNINSLFNIKNGRKFYHALKIAAQDEPHIGMMFIDNLKHDINSFIEKGEFKKALIRAFYWRNSNEKHKFWQKIHFNLKDLDETEKTAPR
jgi:hypothetical protein